MLKIMEAFSKASEYCDVGLCVKASNLHQKSVSGEKRTRPRWEERHE
jgi:hypothetical protein